MTLTEDQLAEWRKVADAATEGPWRWAYSPDGNADVEQDRLDEAHLVAELGRCKDHSGMQGHDAAFIAAARTAMPQLLAEVERLRKHSIMLNGALWQAAVTLGEVPEGAAEIPHDPDRIGRLCAENDAYRRVINSRLPDHLLDRHKTPVDTKLVSCDCSCGDNAKAEAIAIVRGSVETAPETGPGAPWGDKHPTNEAQSETGVRNASGSSQGDSGSAVPRPSCVDGA